MKIRSLIRLLLLVCGFAFDPYANEEAAHYPRPFDRPESGRIAVKVINHYGDEVLKVFEV